MVKSNNVQQRTDGTGLVALGPWLKPHSQGLRGRFAHYLRVKRQINDDGGLMRQVSQGYQYFGFNQGVKDGEPGIRYREWAPAANYLALIGDFNNLDREAHPLTQ